MADKKEINIEVKADGLDEIIEKTNRLVELLREAQQIIDSLTVNRNIETCKTKIADEIVSEINKVLSEQNPTPLRV